MRKSDQVVRVLSSDDLHAVDRVRVSRRRQRRPLHWRLLLPDPVVPKDDLARVGAPEDQVGVKFGKGG